MDKGNARGKAVASAVGLLLGISLVANACGSGSGSGSQQAQPVAAASSPAQAGQDAPATPDVVRTRTRIIFTVSGSAPQGADIMYGSDSDNRSPQGGLGFDGSGSAVPWSGSLRYRNGDLYYDVTAQLDGGGNIRCAVRMKMTAWYSDGTHRSKSETLARGYASGGYNICDAQAEN